MSTSKKLSWLLRHGAGEAELPMDDAGWAEVADVRRILGLSQHAIEETVRENNKNRLELLGTRIRACQGHSVSGMPVTLTALEHSWRRWEGEGPVWHGTRIAALAGIAREGILAVERTHVHLAAAIDSTVGKRAAVDVMIEVSPARLAAHGVGLFVSPNGVVLARQVPAACITGLTPMIERARLRQAELRALLGLDAADAGADARA
jgi:putative RNA 2'-phosphotransferase